MQMTSDEEHDSMVWHKENVVLIPSFALVVLLLGVGWKTTDATIATLSLLGAFFFVWLGITYG
jgi:hypothetical protein